MTRDRSRPQPSGQILIIVAFGMAALMGIGAIVVDLGLSWMLHRQEQNAADPASIAAAAYIEEGDTLATRTKMHTAACFYAQENGFFETDDVTCTAARTCRRPSGALAPDLRRLRREHRHGPGDHQRGAPILLRRLLRP